MKNIKKLLSIVMVLTLVLSLGASAFAATVTIEDDSNGHTYTAYQVFKGTTTTIEGKGEVLASIEWANEDSAADLLAALMADDTIGSLFEADMTAEEAAEAISGMDSTQAEQLGRVLIANKGLLGAGIPIEGGKTVLDPGYYAIEDTTDPLAPADSRNAIVLEVVGSDVKVNSKYDVPSSEKKVKDINDSTGEETDWQDSADWDIGDTIPYQLKATLPKNVHDYTTYYLEFVDNLSKGLKYNEDAKFYVVKDGEKTEITTGFSVSSSAFGGSEPDYAGGTVVLMECNDIIEAVKGVLGEGASLDSVEIVVEYTATLEENAVIGSDGNPNRMHIVFSNNPGGEGKGATPDDTVTVFTFKMDVNKVDGDGNPLAGAGFTLYKEVPAPTVEDPDAVEWKQIGVEVEAAETEDGKYVANFNGLDDGNYKLVESKTPDGYNTIPDVTFTVEATHDEEAADPQLTDLKVTNIEPDDFKFDAVELAGGSLTATIKNQAGVTLPETGGIGTTIFYVVGAILVAGAVILLVTRKRVSGAEK